MMKGFIRVEGRTINTVDCSGIYEAIDIEDMYRRKNGQWQCKHGGWHDRDEECDCLSDMQTKFLNDKKNAIAKCGKCQDGWIIDSQGARECNCVSEVKIKYGKN